MPRVDKIFVIKTNEIKIKVRGVINMRRNRYQEVVELYKSGINDTAVIAEKLKINKATAGKHLREARKNGDIIKTKGLYEQVIEQYNSGVTDIKQIADKTHGKERTISSYITKARSKGEIDKKNSYEEVIKLCNSTEYSLQEIAIKLELSQATIRQYYEKGRKQQLIQKKVRGKKKTEVDFFTQTIKLSQQGISNREIALQLGILEKKVERFLAKYYVKQRKQRKNEEYDAVLKLLRNDVLSVTEISRITGITEKEVKRYIKNAKNNKNVNIGNNYDQVIKLYNSGINSYEELERRLGIKQSTIRSYICRAKTEGKIKRSLSVRQIVEKQYDLESTSIKQIAKTTGISKEVVKRFVSRYESECKRKKLALINQSILSESDMQRIQEKYGLRMEIILNMDQLLKKKYPYEVAQELGISPQIVYDIIDEMNKSEKKRMMECFLINNEVYQKVKAMRKHGVPVSEAIENIKARLKGLGIIELAELYYVLEQKNEAEKILNAIIYGENRSQGLKEVANKKKVKIKQEFKNQEIRTFYKKSFQEYGTKPSYELMCKKFEVRMSSIIELLGKEEICL